MAQKSGSREVVEFIPSMEQKDPKPFTVYFKPLSKGEYDKHINSLGEFKRNKFISHIDQSFRNLCEMTLMPGLGGAFVKNVYWTVKGGTESFYPTVSEKETAVDILCGLQNIELANEIEQAMKSQSSLNEDEIKN